MCHCRISSTPVVLLLAGRMGDRQGNGFDPTMISFQATAA
jgi:hypothetical protein